MCPAAGSDGREASGHFLGLARALFALPLLRRWERGRAGEMHAGHRDAGMGHGA